MYLATFDTLSDSFAMQVLEFQINDYKFHKNTFTAGLYVTMWGAQNWHQHPNASDNKKTAKLLLIMGM